MRIQPSNNDIKLKHLYNGKSFYKWELIEDLNVTLSDGIEYTVPKGTQVDGSTTPFFLKWALPTWGKFAHAALVHDHMYQTRYKSKVWTKSVARQYADDQMYFLSSVYNPKGVIDNLFRYYGVCLFGWILYNRKKK